MTRKTTTTRSNNPMVNDLGEHTVRAVIETAAAIWGPMNLHPGDLKKAHKDLARIGTWCQDNQVVRLADLAGSRAARLLRDLGGVDKLTGIKSAKKIERLHQLRNLITALRGTVLITDKSLTRKRTDRPADDRLDSGLPSLPRRSAQRRALRDDEILLTRLLVEVDWREQAPLLPLHAYCLAESGLMGMESTKATTDNLDDRMTPTKIVRAGVWGFGQRTQTFSPFVANTLARTLPRLRAGAQPLTYTGNAPGTKGAAASLSPVISRFLARAGVTDAGVTPKSLSLWRADHILRTDESFKKALKVHGGKAENLLSDLKYTVDEHTLLTGKVAVCDHTGKAIANVAPKHVLGRE